MRIVVVTSGGPLGLLSLRQLVQDHEIVGVVRPSRRSRRRLLPRRHDRVTAWTRAAHIPSVVARSAADEELIRRLAAWRPDLLCIAGFPWILPENIITLPPGGTLNLHPSALPRHRGPNPLFWTYYHDDRTGGATVHAATPAADAGPILAQSTFPLPRGCPVEHLYLRASEVGAQLYRQVVRGVEQGTAQPRVQDESQATWAPRVPPGLRMVDFDRWGVERVWHFLAGLQARFREPLRDERGCTLRYSAVTGFAGGAEHPYAPGSVTTGPDGWNLWCRGGCVHLARRGPRVPRP